MYKYYGEFHKDHPFNGLPIFDNYHCICCSDGSYVDFVKKYGMKYGKEIEEQ